MVLRLVMLLLLLQDMVLVPPIVPLCTVPIHVAQDRLEVVVGAVPGHGRIGPARLGQYRHPIVPPEAGEIVVGVVVVVSTIVRPGRRRRCCASCPTRIDYAILVIASSTFTARRMMMMIPFGRCCVGPRHIRGRRRRIRRRRCIPQGWHFLHEHQYGRVAVREGRHYGVGITTDTTTIAKAVENGRIGMGHVGRR